MNSDLLHRDPPDHTRLRRLVSGAFTRRRVRGARPARPADRRRAPRRPRRRARRTGHGRPHRRVRLPVADHRDRRAARCARARPGRVPGLVDDARHRPGRRAGTGGSAAATAMVGYVRELVATKRTHPADDLLSALIEARDGADRLTEDELTSMVFLLLVAGHETTVNLIGNGVLHPADPPRPARVAARRAGAPAGHDRGAAALRRAGAGRDVPLDHRAGRRSATPSIPAGELVIPGLLAANRDPARITDADTFDPARAEVAHLAFGHGVHHCLGALRWPVWRAGSRWAACSPASPTCASPCPSPTCACGQAC